MDILPHDCDLASSECKMTLSNSGALLNFYQEMNLYHESIKYSLIQETSEICKVLASWVFHILGLEDFCNFRNNFLKELFVQGKKKVFIIA